MAFLLAGLTFLAVVLIVMVPALLAGGGGERQKIISRRLAAVEKSAKRGNVSLELQLVRDEMLSSVPALHRALMSWSGTGRVREYLNQSGVKTKLGTLVLATGVLSIVAYLVVQHLYLNSFLAAGAGVVAGMCPAAYVALMRNRRLHKFEKNFPDAIDLLGRAVRAGHSFSTGLEMIGSELPEPVAGEFRTTFEEQNFGLPLRDALINLAERVPIVDVRFFVTALLIQKETGGNLAEILDNLARVVRERFRILGEVRIRTAQGRLTAGILIALPPIMGFVLHSLNPNYMSPLFHDPWGHLALAIGLFLQIAGSIMLWKIVNIEV